MATQILSINFLELICDTFSILENDDFVDVDEGFVYGKLLKYFLGLVPGTDVAFFHLHDNVYKVKYLLENDIQDVDILWWNMYENCIIFEVNYKFQNGSLEFTLTQINNSDYKSK